MSRSAKTRCVLLLLGIFGLSPACGDSERVRFELNGVALFVPEAYISDEADLPWIQQQDFDSNEGLSVRMNIPVTDLIPAANATLDRDSFLYGSVRVESDMSGGRRQKGLTQIARQLGQEYLRAERIMAQDATLSSASAVFRIFRSGRTGQVWYVTRNDAPPFAPRDLVGICGSSYEGASTCKLFPISIQLVYFDGYISEGALFAWDEIQDSLVQEIGSWISHSAQVESANLD